MGTVDLSHIGRFGFFILVQVAISLGLAGLVGATLGRPPAYSALIGGGIAILGTLVYALVLCKVDLSKPSSILHLHLIAEMAKLCAMFLVVGILFFFFRQINWIWLFAGFLAAYSAYWFGLLMKN